MIGYRKGGAGYVLVKMDSLYEVQQIKGINNQTVQVDNTFRPENHYRIYGTVIQLPFYMGNMPISQTPIGFPHYGAQIDTGKYDPENGEPAPDPSPDLYTAGGVFDYHMMADIAQEVKIGDKIYFKWRSVHGGKNLIAQTVENKGGMSHIFKIPYDSIYCIARDGKIIMIGSHVFVDPIFETWDEILRPTYYPYLDATGNKIPRPKKEWIQVKVAPSKKDRQGFISHVGTPLKGEYCELKQGDKILFRPNIQNLIQVEGKKYFALKQDSILCLIEE